MIYIYIHTEQTYICLLLFPNLYRSMVFSTICFSPQQLSDSSLNPKYSGIARSTAVYLHRGLPFFFTPFNYSHQNLSTSPSQPNLLAFTNRRTIFSSILYFHISQCHPLSASIDLAFLLFLLSKTISGLTLSVQSVHVSAPYVTT